MYFRDLKAAIREIKRCHRRLEIDHCFRIKNGKMVRAAVPFNERAKFQDGISCRDETIKLMDRRIKRLQESK